MTVADLTVVGGGVLGSVTALLAQHRRPGRPVRLVDQQSILGGATAQSLGVVVPSGDTAGLRARVSRSTALFAEEPLRGLLRPRRALVVAPRRAEPVLRERLVGSAVALADDTDRRVLDRLCPGLQLADGDEVYRLDSGCAVVDTAGLAERIRRSGVDVVEGVRVQRCTPVDGGWELSTTTGPLATRRLAIAAGPWAGPSVDAPDAVRSDRRIKRVVAADAPLSAALDDDPLIMFPLDDLLFLPTAGRLLISCLVDRWRAGPLPDVGTSGWAATVPAIAVDHVDLADCRRAVARRSAVVATTVQGGQAFWDSYPDDPDGGVTTIDAPAPAVRLLGGGGSGVRLAPALADRALDTFRTHLPNRQIGVSP